MKANRPTTIITALCLLLFRAGSDSIQGRGQENIAGKEPVPSYLKGYEKLSEKGPHAAAVEWFKDAKFGLFVQPQMRSRSQRSGRIGAAKFFVDTVILC